MDLNTELHRSERTDAQNSMTRHRSVPQYPCSKYHTLGCRSKQRPRCTNGSNYMKRPLGLINRSPKTHRSGVTKIKATPKHKPIKPFGSTDTKQNWRKQTHPLMECQKPMQRSAHQTTCEPLEIRSMPKTDALLGQTGWFLQTGRNKPKDEEGTHVYPTRV